MSDSTSDITPASSAGHAPASQRDAADKPTQPSPGIAMALWRQTRRIAILLIGVTVILIGVVLIIAPGPATLVIPAGLAILATEFVWARRLLKQLRDSVNSAYDAARGKHAQASDQPQSLGKRCTSRVCEIWRAVVDPFRAIKADQDAQTKGSETITRPD